MTSAGGTEHPEDEEIARWVDGDLDGERAAAVRAHVDLCERCDEAALLDQILAVTVTDASCAGAAAATAAQFADPAAALRRWQTETASRLGDVVVWDPGRAQAATLSFLDDALDGLLSWSRSRTGDKLRFTFSTPSSLLEGERIRIVARQRNGGSRPVSEAVVLTRAKETMDASAEVEVPAAAAAAELCVEILFD